MAKEIRVLLGYDNNKKWIAPALSNGDLIITDTKCYMVHASSWTPGNCALLDVATGEAAALCPRSTYLDELAKVLSVAPNKIRILRRDQFNIAIQLI